MIAAWAALTGTAAILAAVAASTTAFAATYTWTDGAGDHLFSTPGNWQGGVAPTAATPADTLAFTTGGVATNDIAGLTIGDIDVTLAASRRLLLQPTGNSPLAGTATRSASSTTRATVARRRTEGTDPLARGELRGQRTRTEGTDPLGRRKSHETIMRQI